MYSNRMPVWFQNIKESSLSSFKSLALIITVLVLGWQDVHASHLVGGDLTYEYLGNDHYRVTLVVRRDCKLAFPDALFDDPASIGIFDSDGNLLTDLATGGQILIPFNDDDTLNQILINRCTVTVDDVCVHETRYEMIVTLPFRPGGYLLTYERCCRNRSLNNVNDPLNTGMSLFVRLTEEAMQLGNSTPTFNEWAPIYICANERIDFDHSAFDEDGDSLVYRLATPWEGGTRAQPRPQPPLGPPYEHIVWTSSIYSAINMLGNPDDPLTVDQSTGQLTGTPEILGQFVVGLCVDEYRNGVLLSTVHRDFQYNVRDCNLDIRAHITSPDAYCGDLTAYFTNANTNGDFIKWYFDFDGDTTATSTEQSPSYTYPAYGQYRVALIAGLNGVCFDTTFKTITVFEGGLTAGIGWQPVDCADNDLTIQLLDRTLDEEGVPNEWLWTVSYPGVDTTFTEQNPTFHVPNGTKLEVTLKVTSTSTCVATAERSFVANFFDTDLLADSTKVCVGDTTQINPFKDSIPPGVFFVWDPSPYLVGGLDQIMPLFFSADIQDVTLYYTTNNGNGCFYSDSLVVRVLFKPDLQFELINECGFLDVDVKNTSSGAESFIWNFFGTDTVITDRDFTITFPATGTYTVLLSTMDGCMNSTSKTITLIDSTELTKNIQDTIRGCFGDVIELNPNGNPDYVYSWSPPELFQDPMAVNPTFVLDTSVQVTVQVITSQRPDCIIEKRVEVINTVLEELSKIPDTIDACPNTPTALNPLGSSDFTYQWSPGLGLDDANAVNPIATSAVSMVYSVTITDKTDANCTASKQVYLRILVADAIDAIPDSIEICNNEQVVLNPNGNPDLIYTWSPPELFDNPNAVSPTILVTTDQMTIHVHVLDDMGCEAEKDILIYIPGLTYTVEGGEPICAGDEINIIAANMGTQEVTVELNGTTYTVPAGGEIAIPVTPEGPVTYIFNATNASGCTRSDTLSIDVFVFEPPVVATADPTTIVRGESSQLEVVIASSYSTYSWSPPGSLTNPSIPNPVATPEETTVYTVTVTDLNGCTGTDTVQVTVRQPECDMPYIFIPNAFTPNGDGNNDVLYVRGVIIDEMQLLIYNRWGEKVFESTIQSSGWDGTYKNAELPPDVYGYYLFVRCDNGETLTKKGNITLLR